MAEQLDLNTATIDELATLPGVGDELARRVVAHRDEHGPFTSVEDLLAVEGFDARVFERIRRLVTVGTAVRRPPEGEMLQIRLVAPEGEGDFAGHVAEVAGLRDTRSADTGVVPFVVSASTGRAGVADLEIPARATLTGRVTVRVLAPDGEQLAHEQRDGRELPEFLEVRVAPRVPGTTQPNTDPAAGKPRRVRGRVIDAAGRRLAAGLQVVLWGAQKENPQPGDHRALVVAVTDARGHFTGPFPVGTFTAAHAAVGVEDAAVDVPVHLEDGGAFPETVVLVLDIPAAAEDTGCACDPSTAPRFPDAADLARADGTFAADVGMGRCVDFTRPDRTLEEFSYAYVVRTTEPEIHGLTLDEPAKVPGSKLTPFLRAEIAQAVAPFRLGRRLPVAPVRGPVDGRPVDGDGRPVTADELERELPALPEFIDARALKGLSRAPTSSPVRAVYAAAQLTRHGDLQRYLGSAVARRPGRRPLTGGSPVDWDDDPTVYQATTIAHGHVLRFKQEWVADGYSMGSLLYSLPLAPGQKKQIAVVDWTRREATAREDFRESRDSLQAELVRDRDINEVVNGTLRESSRGGSSSSTGGWGIGAGIGVIAAPVGALLGVGGGSASADSSAWQSSSRSTAASALHQLHDRTTQAASSVRTQRTSVVHSVAQGERVAVTTESVANYNHCHALTVQYFEVLRHLLVRERLVDVQECLLVPLLMSWFTDDKALRWRSTLHSAVPPVLRSGFAALDRIDANYAGSDLPSGRYADENLERVEGELSLRFQLARPRDKDDDFDQTAWNPLLGLFGFTPRDFYDQYLRDQKFKDRVFLETLGPKIATAVIGLLRVHAVKNDESTADLRIDPTLVSNFVNDRSLFVSLRMSGALPPVKRSDVRAVVISSRLALPGLPLVLDLLPAGSRIVVESGALRYRTAHLSYPLFSNSFIRNDLTGTDDVRIETPLARQELRNPREEDQEQARALLDHLNENIERYHHVLWSRMSDARRFMLLDGFEAPGSGGRSVASVVENELIGIVGNSLVLPVARGFHLDPTYRQDGENPVDLLEHYQPNTPIEPSRIALPTSGVHAEAVMGACNSCEVIDDTRFWRWEEHPIPDSPSAILPTSTDSRRAAPADVPPTDLPQPIIAMQNAPAAPDPTGLGAAFTLLGQAGVFRDLAGLEGTQKNAAAALQQAFQTATTFGTKAADLALQAKMSRDVDKAMKTIQSAKAQGLIDDKQASELASTAIRGLVGAGATNPTKPTSTGEVKEITKTAGDNKAAVSVTRPTGEKVDVDARPAMPGSSPPVDAGVPPRPAGIEEAPVELELINGTQTLSPLGSGPPLEVRITLPDLAAVVADQVTVSISDGTLATVVEERLPATLLTDGHVTWQWDGRNSAGVFDARVLTRQLTLILTFSDKGVSTGVRMRSLRTRTAREWTSACVDRAAKTITVDVFVDCQNEDDVREAEFQRLRALALGGIGKYWSRSVRVGPDQLAVTTTAHQRANASEDLDLYVETDGDYRRSHNSGIIDASIFYNQGFFGGANQKADEDFEVTAAHEFGHSVLWAVGGKTLSWGHKGSVNHSLLRIWNFQDPSPQATPHPAAGEIDLMKYYTDGQPADYLTRVLAAEEDVLRLIGLSAVTFSFA